MITASEARKLKEEGLESYKRIEALICYAAVCCNSYVSMFISKEQAEMLRSLGYTVERPYGAAYVVSW